MQPITIPPLTDDQLEALETCYRSTRSVRLHTRVQMVLLAAEQRLTAAEIAPLVRCDVETVRRWLKRYLAEGLEGLSDMPRPGAPSKVPPAYRELLVQSVRQRPRSLGLPYSVWTLQRLADYLAEETGIRVADESVRRYLGQAGIALRRPQHTISSPDPEYLLKKRRSSRCATNSAPATSSTTPTNST